MLALDQFHKLQVAGYPGWNPDGDKVSTVFFNVKKGDSVSSRDMAIQFDDVAEGNFYYRDWTDSGIPFVNDGEVYCSRFWFQYADDLEKFKSMFRV